MVEISMLHHVDPGATAHIGPRADYNTTPQELAQYVRARQTWRSLSPEDDLSAPRSEPCFLITFDDGYRDNLTEALPVLERFGTRAIIFVTTRFIDGSAYPYELELASVIQCHDSLRVPTEDGDVDIRTQDAENKLYQQLRQPLKPEPHAVRESRMEKLAELNRYDRSSFQTVPFLTWDEIAELDRHPLITIGAHTQTHPVLTRRFPWTAYHEMEASKQRIEAAIGRDVRHFSYPYGRNNIVVRALSRWIGFRWAFSTEVRRVDGTDRENALRLPRIDIRHLLESSTNG